LAGIARIVVVTVEILRFERGIDMLRVARRPAATAETIPTGDAIARFYEIAEHMELRSRM